MGKRGVIKRSTEDHAIDPTLVNRSSKSFIAPYGQISRQVQNTLREEERIGRRSRVNAEAEQEFGWLNKYVPQSETPSPPKEELTDSEIISQAGVWKNERHTRMMERDYIFPHERRTLGEGWSEDESREYQEQLADRQAEIARNKAGAEAYAQFGWLNSYSPVQEIQPEIAPFEELDLDDPEIIPESTSNQNSPIFTSTGRTYKLRANHNTICVPFGDSGIRKELPEWVYITKETGEFTSCKVSVSIPDYVPREEWLRYCLKKIM